MSQFNQGTLDSFNRGNKRLGAKILTTAATCIYSVPAGRYAQITAVYVTNVGGVAKDLYLFHVANGETAATTNAIYYGHSVNQNTEHVDDYPKTLQPGEGIWGYSNGASHLNVMVYGTLL